ncbi:BTAD domain-containing putative transcriptional regulator [Streptomyces sp. TRM 70351]|uniref:AfsR/SARP family transcriptional regulator n=1 Tax=Streptomyces sp. TRM 70351 TaxID=3116552 RepID=UPI002E7AF31F|nr:BTAD domain-containing putative transcriptional regulator [Streptomyces sp. TRM 70351]MEE1929239.1 BTAD domain-containing putative transcriptional regulator [Streptomyces sp. TRM 70351]
MLHVRLLGPVEAGSGDGRIELGGAKPRALLAALALDPGRVVPIDRLVDVLWSENPPPSARALIHSYVSTLRRSFARAGHPKVVVTRAPGYVLRPESVTVDAHRFTALRRQAKDRTAARDFAGAATLLYEARALWRGPALSGLADSPLGGEARRLDELRTSAAEEFYAAELALGRLDHLAELTALVEAYPADERLRGLLMVTLRRLGRQADALACYRAGRDALVEELGIEPGPELSGLHAVILRGEDDRLPGSPLSPPAPADHQPPAHLPPRSGDFTGRRAELSLLREGLTGEPSVVQVVAGPGGSGKSALAVHAAHQVAGHFPDGQLFAELRGMSDSPATTEEILGGFLRALGVPDGQLPPSTQARVELYRTLLAERRLLILLDDAANEQQVRPLLPAGSDCAVLITARDRLGGLAGARLTELDVLAQAEALSLFTTIVGAGRVRAEPDAAVRILAACSHLPLAIRIAGARLAVRSRLPLAVLADRLDDERHRLDELRVGDLAVRTTISLSFQLLDEQARTALGRLGHLGLPDFSSWVVGWLLGMAEAEAQRLLEVLVDTQLVEFTGVDTAGAGRYRLHDLVRLFAREYAEEKEPADVLRAAVAETLGGWLGLLHAVAASRPPAEMVWQPGHCSGGDVSGRHSAAAPSWPGTPRGGAAHRYGPAPLVPPRGTAVPPPEPPGDYIEHVRQPPPATSAPPPDLPRAYTGRVLADVAGWLAGEEPALALAVERAAALGLDRLVCEVLSAHTAVELGNNRFEFRERITGLALEAARRVGDQRSKAVMHAELAQMRYAQDRFTEARAHYGEALDGFRVECDVRNQATALAGLGTACREPGHLTEALHFLDQAGVLLRALDDHRGIAYVHRIRGSVRLEQGDYPGARDDIDVALWGYRKAGSRRGVALALRTEGLYHRARGDYDEALRTCAEAAEIFAGLGDELMCSYAVRAHAKARFRLAGGAGALPRLEWALGVAGSANDRFGQAVTLRVMGQLHLAEGRLDLALGCLDSAMTLWETMDVRLWRARTEYDLSLVHAALGDTTAAQAARTHAMGVFADRGAREHAELSGQCVSAQID